ncbi:recombination protein RecR [Ammonifex degensii KC4]|uniref:Recombination protein RecR n=1 Tax=Ammonifex degensii (strain DSM 10501 / KC4) TaxID=429009 RepID=C9RAF9_AMMDK|nr:recombination mediator RecR [Ammonifex degensii]ACX53205.1 recombination protein RecR [Ammonifex degensii KC4]
MSYPRPLARLIEELKRLPGIGSRTAQRLAFYLLSAPPEEALRLAEAIKEAREKTFYCSVCGNFTDIDPCSICSDARRDKGIICVVEMPRDVVAIERAGCFKGVYHVLHGVLSPLDGVGPDKLRIQELLQRLQEGEVREVILATSSTTEGEATALYLKRLLKPLEVKVSRLAYGLPVGAEIELADEETISRALEGRREI